MITTLTGFKAGECVGAIGCSIQDLIRHDSRHISHLLYRIELAYHKAMNIIKIRIDQDHMPEIQPELESIQEFVIFITVRFEISYYLCFKPRSPAFRYLKTVTKSKSSMLWMLLSLATGHF
jgi:hypothetical protein